MWLCMTHMKGKLLQTLSQTHTDSRRDELNIYQQDINSGRLNSQNFVVALQFLSLFLYPRGLVCSCKFKWKRKNHQSLKIVSHPGPVVRYLLFYSYLSPRGVFRQNMRWHTKPIETRKWMWLDADFPGMMRSEEKKNPHELKMFQFERKICTSWIHFIRGEERGLKLSLRHTSHTWYVSIS